MDPNTKNKQFKTKLELIKQKEEERRAKRKAEKLNLPYLDLTTTPINPDALAILPKEKAKQANSLIIKKINYELYLAVVNPKYSETQKIVKELKEKGYTCHFFLVSQRSINLGLKRYELVKKQGVSLRGVLILQQEEMKEFEKSLATIQDLRKKVKKLSTSKLLSIIIAGSIKMGSSDIHIEPEKKQIRLRYRIDGLLQDITSFDPENYRFLLSRIKTLSEMMLNVRDVSQDGRFTVKILDKEKEIKKIDIRVSILPSIHGESVVLRLLGVGTVKLDISELGVRKEIYPLIESQINRPNGMVLTTGPTGSGKTTSLYACLNYINKPGKKIITVENPIEYRLPGITQTQINSKKGQTFAQSLKAIVRQDPDALMVGEIRDKESAEIAMHFALTGHIVFSTIHTNDAAATIPRLTDIGIKPSLLPTALNLIIAQRLVRKLCPDCKKAYKPDKAMVESAKKIFSLISAKSGLDIPKKIDKFYKAEGCEKCHGIGYKGRIGIFEVLPVTESIEDLIINQATAYEIRAKVMQEGMVTLMQDAMLKIIEGVTTLDEIRRVIGSPKYIEQLYGDAIMSILTKALIITEDIAEWAKGLKLDVNKIQDKLNNVKMEKLPEWTVAIASSLKASDIHFEAGENDFKIRLRIQGSMEEVATVSKELFLPMVNKIKELAGMELETHNRAQDGRFKISYPDGHSTDARISALPSGYGESLIVRLLESEIGVISLSDLGLLPAAQKVIEQNIRMPNGIIFVTGPTGAGKTTTLYSVLNKLNRPETKIFTIENPIEYRLKGIVQTQVNEEEGYTFANALEALLRQNPNIVMLGEVRNKETAKAAVEASLTGHLVLTTLHTNSAIESIQRLTGLGIDPNDISFSLRMIIAQRLVKKLCDKCKQEIELSQEKKKKIEQELAKIPDKYKQGLDSIKFYQPGKCDACNQKGYNGQIAIFEIMEPTQEIRNQINASAGPNKLQKIAEENGMLTLYQDGLIKAAKGITTLEEVERTTGHYDK